ncbi:sensor histidine kinase [Paenibacillus sp. PL91]|uniref:sensor histidine kinase n=1 Tax=Paenibacillus sp. PL91 TaxID=2729538 RepID=UPI00145EE221|nr:HAMP domain-containing sensor histidine kinase [Paenibacillus sp. PL91]MBC9203512.1 HAMP domain-containing histidine kinase [Paenibacillus sp. PL91]
MNIKRQLTMRFVLQLAIAGLVVLLIAAITVLWVVKRFADISVSHDFASVGLARLVESSELGQNGIRFDPHLLEQVKKNDGWLQSLDENGQVEQSYNTPKDVPLRYNPGELIAYWKGEKPYPYHLYLWIQDKGSKRYTLLYGAPNQIDPLLNEASISGKLSSGGKLLLSGETMAQIELLGGFVQLLDSAGNELASYNRPESIPANYTLQELSLRTLYNERYGYHFASSYEDKTGHTWVVGLPNARSSTGGNNLLVPEEAKVVLIGIIAMFTAILVLFLLLSLWNAHRFGVPMLHMLTWLDTLGKGEYKEPADHKGVRHSRTHLGKWRRRYRVFAEVMHSIDQLSDTLQRDQALRHQTDSLREEWIAGITHDLKTPLSSITGYAHLLAEPKYEWSVEEVRKFSSSMLDKSAHMDVLISDLAMTYRLKTGVRPPEAEEVDLNSWLRGALEKAAANPEFGVDRIVFYESQRAVVVNLYTPWLERVVNNLTANSLLHNPSDTVLTVSILADEGLTIQFADNGTGMDEDTLNKLFERYYRGTDTSSTPNGTGLGMAVSKGLIESMGGRITVETALGRGTIIRLIWH